MTSMPDQIQPVDNPVMSRAQFRAKLTNSVHWPAIQDKIIEAAYRAIRVQVDVIGDKDARMIETSVRVGNVHAFEWYDIRIRLDAADNS